MGRISSFPSSGIMMMKFWDYDDDNYVDDDGQSHEYVDDMDEMLDDIQDNFCRCNFNQS